MHQPRLLPTTQCFSKDPDALALEIRPLPGGTFAVEAFDRDSGDRLPSVQIFASRPAAEGYCADYVASCDRLFEAAP